MNRKIWLFFVLFLSLGLALYSCGGGGGGSSSSSSSSTTKNAQATLGPLGGATVKVYHLLDNGTKVLIHTTTTSTGATLDKIGYFNSYQNELNPNDWYVYEVSGGSDYDVNDDGNIDNPPSPNYGTLCLVARGDEIQGFDEIKVTPVSNMVCNAVKSQFGNPDNLSNAIQDAINNIFDNSTQKPNMEDLLTFNPAKDRKKLKKRYQKAWLNLVKEIRNGAPITSPILYKKQLTEDEGDGGIDIDNNTFYLYYTYDNYSNEDVMLNIEKMSSDNYSFDNITIDLTQQLENDNLSDPNVSDGFIYDGNIYLSVDADNSSNNYCSGIYRVNLDNKSMKLMENTQYCSDSNTDEQPSISSITQANGNLYYLLDDYYGMEVSYSYTLYKKSLSTPSILSWSISGVDSETTIKVSNNNTVYFMLDNGSLSYISGYDNVSNTLQPKSVVDDNNTPIKDVKNISMCDSNAKLLASTYNGLYLIDADNGSVIKKFASGYYVPAAACDSNNYYYIGTNFNTLKRDSSEDYSYSLHIIDKNTYQDKKTVIKFSPDTDIENMIAKDGIIYITTESNLIIIDSYLASKVEPSSSGALQSKIINGVTDYLYLIAKSPDNSLLYITLDNKSGYFLKSLKIPSLDNGSLSIHLSGSIRSYTITQDGSLMFAATSDGSLYKIDLQTQSYRKFALPQSSSILGLRELSYSVNSLSFSPVSNKLYFAEGSSIYSVKIEPTGFDNGSSTTELDNMTELNFGESLGKEILDISVSQDGKVLSVLTDSKIYLFGLGENGNITQLSQPYVLPLSSSDIRIRGGKFLRAVDSTNAFYFTYTEDSSIKNKIPPVHTCTISFNTNDNSSKMDCSSFTTYVYWTYYSPIPPVFIDLSGIFVSPSNYGMNMDYLSLFAVPTKDSLQNISGNSDVKQFTLSSSEGCYYQDYRYGVYFVNPLLLIGNTLYGTYCSYTDDSCKIFYTKAANTQ